MTPKHLTDLTLKLGIQGGIAILLICISAWLASIGNGSVDGFLALAASAVAWTYKNGNGDHAAK